jgi:indoleamine 2,3-dioxygenase
MALNNWVRLDRTEPVSADNATMQVRMQGGTDEDWFFIASLGVELASAPLIRGLVRAHAHALHATDVELGEALRVVVEAFTPVTAALERVRQWCTPEVFYGQLRRYMTGPPEPGLRFEGVDARPRTYVGGSAGQSSVLQAVDATLGIGHGDSPTGQYLRMIRGYMPPAHRRLVEVLEATSRVRARVLQSSDPPLREAYNHAVELLTDFRRRHRRLALDYIIKPSNLASGQRGTGGTNLASFLQSASDASVRSQVG